MLTRAAPESKSGAAFSFLEVRGGMSSLKDFYFGVRLPTTTEEDRADFEKIVNHLLLVNTLANGIYRRKNPDAPFLYDSGVLYAPPEQADARPVLGWLRARKVSSMLDGWGYEPETVTAVLGMLRGMETLYDTERLYKRGKGDCNELVPSRLGELWRAGVHAAPFLVKDQKDDGGWAYHALVLHPDGSSEDPSLILGMGGPEAAPFRREECRKNAERYIDAKRSGLAVGTMGYLPRSGAFADPYQGAA
jgi:hypothetical protein